MLCSIKQQKQSAKWNEIFLLIVLEQLLTKANSNY